MEAKKIKTVELLLDGRYTQQEIADMVGVSRQTIHNWRKKDDEFKKYYKEREMIQKELIQNKFSEKLDVVSSTVFDIITDDSVNPTTRLNASTYWIDRVLGKPNSTIDMNSHVSLDGSVDEQDILRAFEELESD